MSAPGGQQVPLSALAAYEPETAPLTVGHQGLFPAVTISFNLAANASLGDAVKEKSTAAAALTAFSPKRSTRFLRERRRLIRILSPASRC